MMDKQTMVFCPIHNCGCYDLSCDGVLPVHTHEDCQEHEDGETRLKLVCFKGDVPYELPGSYTQGELDQMIAEFVSQTMVGLLEQSKPFEELLVVLCFGLKPLHLAHSGQSGQEHIEAQHQPRPGQRTVGAADVDVARVILPEVAD